MYELSYGKIRGKIVGHLESQKELVRKRYEKNCGARGILEKLVI